MAKLGHIGLFLALAFMTSLMPAVVTAAAAAPALEAAAAPVDVPITGEVVRSASDQYTLLMQTDGNLVVYGNGTWIWASGTRGSAASRLIMQADGNAVIYDNGSVLWSTGTRVMPNATGGASTNALVVSDAGELVVRDASGYVQWRSDHSRASLLAPGATLIAGQSSWSPSSQYQLVMQADGNLVMYGNGTWIWQSGTSGQAGTRLVMQTDGNLVVYGAAGALWNSRTFAAGASLRVVDDGNAVVGRTSSEVLWFSGNRDVSTMYAGGVLPVGGFLSSTDGSSRLVFQADGNIVFYFRGAALWSQTTRASVGPLQYSGPLELTAGGSLTVRWEQYARFVIPQTLSSFDCQGANLVVTNRRTADLVCPDGRLAWSTHPLSIVPSTWSWGGVIRPGQSLPGQGFLSSAGGGFDLYVYAQPQATLTARRYPFSPGLQDPWLLPSGVRTITANAALTMQLDGNLVFYGASGPIWSSQTYGAGNVAIIQDDGNLVVYAPTGQALWNACGAAQYAFC